MAAIQLLVMPKQLQKIREELGSDLCRASELLASKLRVMPKGRSASPREFAELREAKSLFVSLKYPDSVEPVRLDELAWALKRIRVAYETDADPLWLPLLNRIAAALGVDLDAPHPIPVDLDRRISNELIIISRPVSATALQEAV